jgi:shikimate kinase
MAIGNIGNTVYTNQQMSQLTEKIADDTNKSVIQQTQNQDIMALKQQERKQVRAMENNAQINKDKSQEQQQMQQKMQQKNFETGNLLDILA